jgi:hypothetical protein
LARPFGMMLPALLLAGAVLPVFSGDPEPPSALPAALPDPGKTLRPLPEFLLVMRTVTDSSDPTPASELQRLQTLSWRKILGINRHSDFIGSIGRNYQTGRIVFDIAKVQPPRFTPAQVEAARQSPEADTAIYNEAIQKKLGAMTRERWVSRHLSFFTRTTSFKVNGHVVIRAESHPRQEGDRQVIDHYYFIPALNYIRAGFGHRTMRNGILVESWDEFPEILRIGESVPAIFSPAPEEPSAEVCAQLIKDGWLPKLQP